MAFFDFLSGADEAADEAKKAQRRAEQFQQQGQQRASDLLSPAANYGAAQSRLYDLSGLNGLQSQQTAFGDFRESPQYAFLRQQGEQSAQRAAAAGGQLASGRTLADLSRYGQGLADQSYNDYYNRISGLYGQGLGAANSLAGIYSNSGNRLADIAMQGGAQQAGYAQERGGMLGGLLSQGALLAGMAATGGFGVPGGSGSSYPTPNLGNKNMYTGTLGGGV